MWRPIHDLAFAECHTQIAYEELRKAHRFLVRINRNLSLCEKARACAARDAKNVKRVMHQLKRIG